MLCLLAAGDDCDQGCVDNRNSHGVVEKGRQSFPGGRGTSQGKDGIGCKYNTLLDLKSEEDGMIGGAADDASFGQYLARKWGDVFRE